jgi:hypothetical protein|tara:strand:+ start:2366 stop:3109 length:744 start_codon:yes stop_codon:yes gene_type:complete
MGLPIVAVPEYSLELPSNGKEIRYRPFLVKEEKLLLIAMESEEEKQILDSTKKVIENCVFGDIDIDKLPTFDIEYIFLWLRARSKGEVIELKYKCPTCKGQIPISFNVEDIKIKRHESHKTKIEINDTLGVVMKYPNITSTQGDREENDTDIDVLLKTILKSIDYIYDNDSMYSSKDYTENELQDFLESLNDKQFKSISEFFETMPKISHTVTLECANKTKGEGKKKDKVCGYKEELVLEGLQSFFE